MNFAKSIPDYPYPEPKKEIEIVTQGGQTIIYGDRPRSRRRSGSRHASYDYNGAYPGQLGYDNGEFRSIGGLFRNLFSLSVKIVGSIPNITLTDEDLLLTSPIVYGFSLVDKRWSEFNSFSFLIGRLLISRQWSSM